MGLPQFGAGAVELKKIDFQVFIPFIHTSFAGIPSSLRAGHSVLFNTQAKREEAEPG